MKRHYYSLLLILLFGLTAHAQLRIEVEAPTSVDINEPYFQIRYTINTADVSDFAAPQFTGFDVLAGPSVSTRQNFSSVNGHNTSSSSRTYTFTLAPQRTGKFTLQPAAVQAGGKSYRSRQIHIQVTGKGERNTQTTTQRQSAPAEQLRTAGSNVSNNDLYITADIRRKQTYEQEAVLITYRFHERPGVGLNSIALSKKPDFKGVVSQDIPVKSIDATVENINGRTYRTGVIQQYLVFPQQSGKITIPGITFDCVVIQRSNIIDPFDAFFNGGGNVGKSLKRTVPEITLDVKPLPTPKPADFSGAVGKFAIKGELLSPAVKTNEISTFRLTVSGTGNLKLITPPALQWPAGFEAYAPKTSDNTRTTNEGTTGDMVFDYTFIARNTGKHELPAVSFSYFNPENGKYENATIPSQHVIVEKGERSEEDIQQELQLRGSDIRSPRPTTEKHQFLKWNSLPYWGCFAGIILIAGIILSVLQKHLRLQADTVSRRNSKAGKMAARALRQAKVLSGQNNPTEFYAAIARALYDYAGNKFNIETAAISRERITAEMSVHQIPEPLTETFDRTLETCELARFAPQGMNEDEEKFYESTCRLLTDLEEAYRKGKRLKTNPTVSS